MPLANSKHANPHAAMTGAQRLKRVFKIDIITREECCDTVKVAAKIEDPAVRLLSLTALLDMSDVCREPRSIIDVRVSVPANCFLRSIS